MLPWIWIFFWATNTGGITEVCVCGYCFPWDKMDSKCSYNILVLSLCHSKFNLVVWMQSCLYRISNLSIYKQENPWILIVFNLFYGFEPARKGFT